MGQSARSNQAQDRVLELDAHFDFLRQTDSVDPKWTLDAAANLIRKRAVKQVKGRPGPLCRKVASRQRFYRHTKSAQRNLDKLSDTLFGYARFVQVNDGCHFTHQVFRN